MGLLPASVEEVVSGSRGLQAALVAVPSFCTAALLASSRGRGWSAAAGAAVAAVASAAILPLAIILHNRRLFQAYVKQSLSEDLSSIETFYGAAGAGRGSMFLVAELVEPGIKPSPSQPLLFRSASLAAFGNGEVQMQPLPVPATAAPAAAAPSEPVPPLAPPPQAQQPVSAPAAAPAQAVGSPQPPLASAAAMDPADEEDAEMRATVAGLVSRAVARIETAALEAAMAAGDPATSSPDDLGDPGPCDLGAAELSASAAPAPSPPVAGNTAPSAPDPPRPPAPDPPPAAPTAAIPVAATAAAQPVAAAPSPAPSAIAKPASIIVGHVALERKSWQVAELRRMSVAPGYRGLGIGRKLLEVLVQQARDNSFRELILHTSSLQVPARKLYESAGWEVTKVSSAHGITFYSYRLDLTAKKR
ncbi:N-acetyltransferase 14 [Tetrabaena socialis]|uniref:N-acetyltransferase 14 n=1 Tax=Tetrabaena socialis TaxID=47790 RepID=A0A2J8AC01_9CHLO|nr:N-acetyltransferase 14 [Tetrabaena socialis]|eukprot:PNH10045.1 N-acetyltransferase 14 [Tetrabaena socialis]